MSSYQRRSQMRNKIKVLKMPVLLVTLMTSSFVYAGQIEPTTVEVFVAKDQVTQTVDVKSTAKGLVVYTIDNVNKIEDDVSKQIPPMTKAESQTIEGREKYKVRVISLIKELSKQKKNELMKSWGALEKAVGYGIINTPAIVIDSTYVAYGTTVKNAVFEWRKEKVKSLQGISHEID
ncbi:DUF1525 domain-containing protein [Vibrio sp. S11_S32]|uniref:DUF1525 domain-containing protein n=1 Tax=Vibrio sp. S11_S32 TaxID=2720225 RepID=UPI0016815033|nr:DUF1525 domain-containing protein [Vibrio sp. S11_S32]MBD1577113.1 DUF1525 domain-containing protein [Vibrio sp. S11_S32]